MSLLTRLEARAWCPCKVTSHHHTHCPTCGSWSVLHNRAECTIAPFVQRARAGQLPPKIL